MYHNQKTKPLYKTKYIIPPKNKTKNTNNNIFNLQKQNPILINYSKKY